MKRTAIILGLAIFSLSLFAESATAQIRPRRRPVIRPKVRHHRMIGREKLGLRFGQDIDNQQYLVGAQLWIPAGLYWRFVPSFDYHFVNEDPNYTRWQFNGDLIFQPQPFGLFYFGGGLAVQYLLPEEGNNTTDFGGNALIGLQSNPRKPMSLFIQARWSFFDETYFSVIGGVNLALR